MKKLKCLFTGHKWIMIYPYGLSALYRCTRCDKSKTFFVHDMRNQ